MSNLLLVLAVVFILRIVIVESEFVRMLGLCAMVVVFAVVLRPYWANGTLFEQLREHLQRVAQRILIVGPDGASSL